MDLSDISYRQATADANLANERVVEISLKIHSLASRLDLLRKEVERLSGQFLVMVEYISDVKDPDFSGPLSFPHGEALKFVGWIVPTKVLQKFSRAVVIMSNDTGVVRMGCDISDRNDVAQHFGNVDLLKAGFEIMLPAKELKPGIFDTALDVETDDGRILSKNLGQIEIVA